MQKLLPTSLIAGATLALATALAFAPALPACAQYALGTDGGEPTAQLTLGSDGLFYSVASVGGAYGEGTLFSFDPHGDGNIVILHNFGGENSDANTPYEALIQDENGNFYGISSGGGKNGYGAIYMLTADGRYFNLYSFTSDSYNYATGATLAEYAPDEFAGVTPGQGLFTFTVDADATPKPVITAGPKFLPPSRQLNGSAPVSLVSGTKGLVYGATSVGGSLGFGSLFSFDPSSGVVRTLHDFSAPEGNIPEGPLLYSDGKLYGTTVYGGIYRDGTIFSCDTEGNFRTIYQFDGRTNGFYPIGGLAFGTNGDLYATANSSGKYGFGTVLDFTGGDGSPNHHYSFDPTHDSGDGAAPEGGLTLGNDGVLYGTTASGGKYGFGTIYSIDQATLHHVILHSFGKPLAK